jgi:toluene monooxygenase system protein E
MTDEELPMKEETYRTYSTWNERKIPTTYDTTIHRTNYDIGERYDREIPRMAISSDQPLPEWYRKHREGSVINGEYPDDFDAWRDPRELSYEKYNELMDEREVAIETLYEQAEVLERGTEREDDPWLEFQRKGFLPLRYPVHGLQMLASYLAMIGPSSTISTSMAFQATDEIRRQERLARRATQLQKEFPDKGFTETEQEVWEDHEMWQPLREAMEQLLVEYDWGKSFVGTNLVLKPLLDELVLAQYSELFEKNDSDLYAQVLDNFYLDTDRSRELAVSVADHVIEIDEENRNVMQETIDEWYPTCHRAIEAFEPAFESMPPETMSFENVLTEIDTKYESMFDELSLAPPS